MSVLAPFKAFTDFLQQCVSGGFGVGFDCNSCLKPAPRNFRSVNMNPSTIGKYIAEEVTLGRLVVVYLQEVLPGLCGSKGTLMAKTDLQSVHRQVPAHVDGQELLSIE